MIYSIILKIQSTSSSIIIFLSSCIFKYIPLVDIKCFYFIPLINIHFKVTARRALGRKKNSLSFEQIYYWCIFLYTVIKASLLPHINFMTLFVLHMNAKLQFTFLSAHGLDRFILLSRKEMLYYIRHEFIAGLKFSLLEDLFQEAVFITEKKKGKLIQLQGRTRVLVFSIVEFPVEALLWFARILITGCVQTMILRTP